MKKLILLTFVTVAMVALMILWPTLVCGVSESSPVLTVTYENLMANWTIYVGTDVSMEYGYAVFDYPEIMILNKEYDCTVYTCDVWPGLGVVPMKWKMTGTKNPRLIIYNPNGTFNADISYVYAGTTVMEGPGYYTTGLGNMSVQVHLVRIGELSLD